MVGMYHIATGEYRIVENAPNPEFLTGWLEDPEISTSVQAAAPGYRKVEGESTVVEMTQAEKDAVDVTGLSAFMVTKIMELKDEVTQFIYDRYSNEVQKNLLMQKDFAREDMYPNRGAQIRLAFDWINDVIGEFYDAQNAIKAATTLGGIHAVSIDFNALDAADPEIDLEVVRLIVD